MVRKEKKYHFIYKTTNILSGKYYIGMHSTDDLDDGYLGSGTRLRYSINKHGKENFIREILEFCKTREELKNREGEIVNLNEIAKIDCINLKVGGFGGFSSEEHKIKYFTEGVKNGRLKTNEFLKNKFGDNFQSEIGKNFRISLENDKTLKDDWILKTKIGFLNAGFSEGTFKNKKHSEETKKLMSESSKGNGVGESNSQFGTCWITKDGTNKKIKKEGLETYQLDGWVKGRK
jgi:hypothetical protein